MADRTQRTDSFWRDFCAETGCLAPTYDVVGFGDSPQMMDELSALVTAGQKRATAGLLRDFQDGTSPVPKAGDYVVVVDGAGAPQCIYQSSDVRVGLLNSVDAQFAWDEGEGDRSLAYWLAEHRAFFRRQAAAEGFEFHDGIETVFERFRVVWPPAIADP